MENATRLCRLTGAPRPRKFITVDIETFQWVKKAYSFGVYDGEEFHYFLGDDCIEKGVDFLLQMKFAGSWIYAHNGGGFDFQFFLEYLMTSDKILRKYEVDIIPVGSSMVSMEVSEKGKGKHSKRCQDSTCTGCVTKVRGGRLRKRQSWMFVDSLKLMPVALGELGPTFDLGRKVELPMTYDQLAQPENRAVMLQYLEQDCKLLYRAVEKMQTIVNELGGQVGVTLASTALDLFRRKHQREDIYTNRHWLACPMYGKEFKRGELPPGACTSCLHDFIRQAYFGGRSEIFRMRFEPYVDEKGCKVDVANYYDVNSHYPSCMLAPMPTGPAMELHELDESAIYSNARRFTGIVECEVWIPEDCYLPPLPVVATVEKHVPMPVEKGFGKLIFPTGKFWGVWDTAELVLLKKVGGKILQSKRSVWFENTDLFGPFVRELYKFRDKKSPTWNKGLDWIAKQILNSSYGKFAMVETREKVVVNPTEEDYATEKLEPLNMEANTFKLPVKVSPVYIVPLLSTHVTAIARARLWEIMKGVVDRGGRLYYTDTDSVICSGVNLDTSTSLGHLKLEDTVLRAQFVLPKLYLLKTVGRDMKKKNEQNIKVRAKGMGPGIRITAGTEYWDEEGNRMVALTDDEDDGLNGQLSEESFMQLAHAGYFGTETDPKKMFAIRTKRITKVRESLAALGKKAGTFPRIIESSKQMRTRYDKRRILDNYDTAPLVFKSTSL